MSARTALPLTAVVVLATAMVSVTAPLAASLASPSPTRVTYETALLRPARATDPPGLGSSSPTGGVAATGPDQMCPTGTAAAPPSTPRTNGATEDVVGEREDADEDERDDERDDGREDREIDADRDAYDVDARSSTADERPTSPRVRVAAARRTAADIVAATDAATRSFARDATAVLMGAAAPAADDPARVPGDVIDLEPWYLTLPTGKPGDPDTVENPDLAAFTNEFFKLNDEKDGVVFSARGDGVTTKNSKYPRSELREMNGTEKAAWSNTSGTHTLDVCEAITKVPQAKPEVVAAQIHDGNDDVLQIRLEGKTLMVQYDDGKSEAVIDPDYALGTPYQVKILSADSKVEVHYNGEKKADLPLSGEGWYWKVGAYVQSNASKGDGADAVGEVTVYGVDVKHTGRD